MKTVCVLFLMFSFWCNVSAQSLVQYYDIHIGKENAGEAVVKKVVEGKKTIYTLQSKAVFHVMGIAQKIEESLKVVYIGGKVFSSEVVIHKNGSLHKSSKATLLTNGHYKLVTNGNEHDYKEPIVFSSVLLYFQEPKVNQKTFAEGEGVIKNISNEKDGIENYYSVREGYHGNPSDFYYVNGELKKVVVDYHVTTFEMRRR